MMYDAGVDVNAHQNNRANLGRSLHGAEGTKALTGVTSLQRHASIP
jgi:hypothetical protein